MKFRITYQQPLYVVIICSSLFAIATAFSYSIVEIGIFGTIGLVYGIVGLYKTDIPLLFWIWAFLQVPYSISVLPSGTEEPHWNFGIPFSVPISCSFNLDDGSKDQFGLNILPFLLMYFWVRFHNRDEQEKRQAELDTIAAAELTKSARTAPASDTGTADNQPTAPHDKL